MDDQSIFCSVLYSLCFRTVNIRSLSALAYTSTNLESSWFTTQYHRCLNSSSFSSLSSSSSPLSLPGRDVFFSRRGGTLSSSSSQSESVSPSLNITGASRSASSGTCSSSSAASGSSSYCPWLLAFPEFVEPSLQAWSSSSSASHSSHSGSGVGGVGGRGHGGGGSGASYRMAQVLNITPDRDLLRLRN